ncbi:hypothetical protein LCGC14_1214870 [marine sediment metagenome]|uniref:Dehydrogenase E1 component domain-containing protein n=1 Tax=marine sediment metagenome TaxID=412755 RepID=A0A0F9NVB6_9ZZZZ
MNKADLILFEVDIADLFEQAKIPSPVHLSKGNEEELIEIFKSIKKDDFVFSNHRSHYHALLKGIPPEWLKAEILANRSITINNSEYRFFSSAIVGGILPIAVGVAMTGQTVWCFCGDMAGHTGMFYECQKYAQRHNLPITFVIEDNGHSVCSPTEIVWGTEKEKANVIHYQYESVYPHQGSSDKFVVF